MVQEVRVLVFGSAGVGKSALVILNVKGVFIDKYDPTIEDSYRKQFEVDNEQYVLEILDTAGTISSMTQHYIKNTEAFIFVYSVTSRATFKEISSFKNIVTESKGIQVPMVLVGNKIDLSNDRVIKTDEGKRLAAEWKCAFVETSAKTGVNASSCITELVREVQKCDPSPKKKDSWCIFL